MFTSILALTEKSGLLLCFRPWAVVLGMMATASYFTGSLFLPDERITQANYQRINVGMTIDEVSALLGKPNSPEDDKLFEAGNFGERLGFWTGERQGKIAISFDEAGRVIDKKYKGPCEEICMEEILWNWIGKRL